MVLDCFLVAPASSHAFTSSNRISSNRLLASLPSTLVSHLRAISFIHIFCSLLFADLHLASSTLITTNCSTDPSTTVPLAIMSSERLTRAQLLANAREAAGGNIELFASMAQEIHLLAPPDPDDER